MATTELPESHTSLAARAHLLTMGGSAGYARVATNRVEFRSAGNHPHEAALLEYRGVAAGGRHIHELPLGGAAVHVVHALKSNARFTLCVEHPSGFEFRLGSVANTHWGLRRVSSVFEGGFPAHRHPGSSIYVESESPDPVFAVVEVVLSPRALAEDKTKRTVVMYGGSLWQFSGDEPVKLAD